MKFCKLKGVAVFIAISLLSISCAKEPSESWQDSELQLIKATQKIYFPQSKYPDVMPLNADSSLWLISHTKVGSGDTPKNGDYVVIDYTGRLLPSDGGWIFRTTDSTTARKLGTFAYTTHFAPIFTLDTVTVQDALLEAYSRLRVGDEITIMSASWLAFGADISGVSMNGESALPANVPIIFTINMRDIVKDPKQRELDMVQHYVDSINTLRPETFVQAKDYEGNLLEGFYISYRDTVPLQDSASYAADGDEVSVKYAGFYLEDNFLLSTNIDSVAKRGWSVTYSDTTHFNYTFTEDASNTLVIQAMHIALRNVALGSWVEIVFTSTYGYGVTGSTSNAARPIYPYTPLRYRVFYAKNSSEE